MNYCFIISFSGGLMEQMFNEHLGNKLRMRRLSLGLTQTKVAKAINVTFQQIQKYEKGTNGVSSTRLMQLASFLNVPITYFFEDYKNFNENVDSRTAMENINYSFLVKLFNSLSVVQKEKLVQILKNTDSLEKTG